MTQSNIPFPKQSPHEPVYRRNFFWFLIDNILFTIAMGIIGTTTVIPDFLRQLTDSEILIGFSGSLFTVGYTLPQLIVARYIVRYARKKWWFIGPNIPTRLIMLAFGIFVWYSTPDQSQLVLLAFFLAYGIAAFGDGLVGVPWADLTGTSLDNKWRARMFGIATIISGILMLGIAPIIGFILGDFGLAFPSNYAFLFIVSGLIFVISIIPGIFIHELPGGKAVDKLPAIEEFLPELGRILRDDLQFRAYIILRIFTNLFMMAFPFYIGYATITLGLSSEVAVPNLLAMQTIGSLAGALIYTYIGAKNNLLYIRLAVASGALLPIAALLANVVGPLPLYIGFLISGLAYGSNLFSSFMQWIVDYADADQRPTYVGLANTITAIASLVAPFIGGTIAQHLGYEILFVVSMGLAIMGLYVSVRYMHNTKAKHTEA
jgi:MFS family permease